MARHPQPLSWRAGPVLAARRTNGLGNRGGAGGKLLLVFVLLVVVMFYGLGVFWPAR